MANMQPTPTTSTNSGNAYTEPLTPITLFLRYLYLGSSSGSISIRTPPDLTDIENKLFCVIQMASAHEELPITTITKVYESKMYTRVDEILIALAYCAKQMHSEKLRVLANDAAIQLINNQADFLLFADYYNKISPIIRGNGHTHFAHGMCRVIEKWYAKYSPIELANMFGEHRSLHGLTHQSVVKKAHLRTKKRTPNGTVNANAPTTSSNAANSSNMAATNVNTIEMANLPSTSSNANAALQSNNQNEAAASEQQSTWTPISVEDDREMVFRFLFLNGQKYLKYLKEQPQLGAGAKRMKNLQKLKTNENVVTALESIRRNQFSLEQMPSHLLEKIQVWEVLLPNLSSRKLLNHFHTLKDLGFLNEDTPFTRTFLNVFGNPTKMKLEKICPIDLYIQKTLYKKNMRYLGTKKAEYYEKKMLKRKVTTNQLIEERLDEMFRFALFKASPSPAKFFIVMDLRRGNLRKPILRNKHITCFDAAFTLAYSIYVREKDTLVYSFTDSKDKLKRLGIPRNDYKSAKEATQLHMITKTVQCLARPIKEATMMRKRVDVFVVIVDSVARFCRQGQVPVKEFTEFRDKINNHAKYVVINLARSIPDLKIPETDNMKGFFEICGFNQDTPKILNALANHCFA